jgi:hypothetical protein
MKTDSQEINRYLSESHTCAMQMMMNAAYIQKELPNLTMPDDLRATITNLCDELIGTKHDLMNEIIECRELMVINTDTSQTEQKLQVMHQWIIRGVQNIQECVTTIQQRIADHSVEPLVGMLVMESAVNVISSIPAYPEAMNETFKHEEDDNQECEDEADDYDPNCYAFYCEDSYPIGQLIAVIRSLAKRPELTAETLDSLKVFLFAMQRLPLITHEVRMSLALRLDQGGESDWIEIRMGDGEFSLCRGTWIDGDADTESIFEVTSDYRDGDAFMASQFAESFAECARDVCREIVIDDTSDEPFTAWDLKSDKSRWSELPCSFD